MNLTSCIRTEMRQQEIEMGDAPKIKRSRWGPSTPSTLTNLPAAITAPMTAEQLEAYTMCFRIEEITQNLQTNTILPESNHPSRSPSPPPEYDPSGRRTNTRHDRHRLRLERERYVLIQQAIQLIPGYRAPAQYHASNRGRGPTKLREKVYIPVRDFPSVSFIGQLLGPRGRSLDEMCAKSGAKIVIRGKGSVKEGRGRGWYNHRQQQEENEPLHCLVIADTPAQMEQAKRLVQGVIEDAIVVPEGENQRKTRQLRDLAVLNGTFRDLEGRQGLGDDGGAGRLPGVICRVCGGGGHIARDCGMRKRGAPWRNPPWRREGESAQPRNEVDEMYSKFLLEMEGGT